MNKPLSAIFFVIGILLFSYQSVVAQAPMIQWQHCYGGSADEVSGSNIIYLSDSSYILTGTTYSNDGDISGNHGVGDYWVFKIDQYGNLIWQKCYGGSTYDASTSMVEGYDGGLIVCGVASSNDGEVTSNHSVAPLFDVWLIKLDIFGNLQWQKCFGGSGDDISNHIIRTTDSAYVFVGQTTSNDGDVGGNHSLDTNDIWLVKIDTVGNILWHRCFGGSRDDEANSVIQTNDGGFMIAGRTYSNDGDITYTHDTTGNYDDMWVIKTDSLGNLQWQRCIGGSGHEIPYSIIQDVNGNYLLAGSTNSNDGDISGNHQAWYYDLFALKLNSSGNILWQKCYGGTGNEFEYSAVEDSLGGLEIFGSTESNDGDVSGNHSILNQDFWLIGIDSIGNLQWQKCYGGSNHEYARALISTSDGGYLVSGSTISNDGDVSNHHLPINSTDIWVVKLSAAHVGLQYPENYIPAIQCFYDPVQSSINLNYYSENADRINLTLYDVTGRTIQSQRMNSFIGMNNQNVETFRLTPGIYLVRLETESGSVTRKVVVE